MENVIQKPLWGMIQYTILEDGGLSGIWTNSLKDGDNAPGHRQLFTEIARKHPGEPEGLAGLYRCAWIDEGPDFAVTRTLEIRQAGIVYHFVWRNGPVTSFTGVGMRLGPKFLVVTYWEGGASQFNLPPMGRGEISR